MTTITRTFTFNTTAEGFIDLGTGDFPVKFVGSDGSPSAGCLAGVGDPVGGGIGSARKKTTWVALGVWPGATVTEVRVLSLKFGTDHALNSAFSLRLTNDFASYDDVIASADANDSGNVFPWTAFGPFSADTLIPEQGSNDLLYLTAQFSSDYNGAQTMGVDTIELEITFTGGSESAQVDHTWPIVVDDYGGFTLDANGWASSSADGTLMADGVNAGLLFTGTGYGSATWIGTAVTFEDMGVPAGSMVHGFEVISQLFEWDNSVPCNEIDLQVSHMYGAEYKMLLMTNDPPMALKGTVINLPDTFPAMVYEPFGGGWDPVPLPSDTSIVLMLSAGGRDAHGPHSMYFGSITVRITYLLPETFKLILVAASANKYL